MTDNYNPYQAPQSDWNDEQDGDFELLEEPSSLNAGSGISWVGEAWQIFKARPLLWIGLILAYIGFIFVMGVLSIIPLLGFVANIAIGIIVPMLMAGVYYIAYCIDNDEDVSFGDVTIAFSQGKTKDFIFLWLWQFLMMLGFGVGFGIVFAIMFFVFGISPETMENSLITILLLLIMLAFIIPIAMMSIFSPILILFHDLEAWDAMKLSLKGCMRNILPFLLNGIMFGLLSIVGIITLGLGFFVIAPIMMICMYIAYRQIFLGY